ncbi:sulfotransferase domain-containing protein [Martelella sp. FLE1502]
MQKKLGFLICGVQKGGTTALWHFLRQHPAIGFGVRKEMHFFDNDTLSWNDIDYGLLHSEYAAHTPGRLWGDATPILTYWPECLARIHAYSPTIKLIVSLRDPIERAYSHWMMETGRGTETLEFGEAIRQGRERVRSQPRGVHRVFSYVERGFYADQLDRLFTLFSAKQVLLLRQIDIKTHHRETLDRICDFLEIERFVEYPAAEPVFSPHNFAKPRISQADADYLREVYYDDMSRLKQNYRIDFMQV